MASGLLGGALIGLAATVYWLSTGRSAGISGILAGVLNGAQARGERVAFLGGLVLAGLAAAIVASPASAPTTAYPVPVLVVAGLLVGFGTRLGGGCTSGHGVCGISRFSRASLVATATFIAAGAATVAVASRIWTLGVTP